MSRKFQMLILIVLIVLSLSSSKKGVRSLQPEPTMTIYGYVLIRTVTGYNISAPAGLYVHVEVDNETVSNSTTISEGRYVLLVTDQEDETFLDIWVQDIKVANITFQSWNVTWLNLTVVDVSPPKINPLHPVPGAILLGYSIEINASLYDNLAIDQSAMSMTLNQTEVEYIYYPEQRLITYRAKNVDQGFYLINVTVSDLSGNKAYEAWNFTMMHPTPPSLSILSPTTEDPVYIRPGDTVQVVFNYTEPNPVEAKISIFNATHVIKESQITLDEGTNLQRNDTILIEENTADDKYALNVTISNIYNLSQTDMQTYAIIVDNTPPLVQDVHQNPPAYSVYPYDQVQVNATVKDMLSGIDEVYLLWRTEDSEWNNVTMYRVSGDIYNRVIQAYENCTTIYYRIEAVDKAGNIAAEDNAGEFYTYHVIPEFLSIINLALLFVAVLIIVTIRKRLNPLRLK